jgi:hypothetical protein
MATIKFKRGSGQPTGLTAYEPAWDTTNNRLFINNGTTAMWIGAKVDNDTTLVGNCAFTIPTQNAVKTYVDSQVAGGAVTSVNGSTGAVTIGGGTGISITTSTATRGVTIFNAGVLSVNGNTGAVTNVAFTNTTNSFSAQQTFTSGVVVTSGMTLSDTLRVRGSITDPGGKIELWDENNTYKKTLQPEATTAKDSTFQFGGSDGFVVASNTDGATVGWIVRAAGAGLANTWINPAAVGFSAYQSDRTDRLLLADTVSNTYYFDFSGGKTGYQLHYTSNNMVWNETTSMLTAPNANITAGLTASNLRVTSIANFAGGLCASGGTFSGSLTLNGNAVTTVANTVASISGTANQITASGSTGSVTLSLPSALIAPGSLTVTGNLTVNGTTTTVNSTTVTVQDPLIAIGGLTGNIPPVVGDVKDRGILFQYYSGAGRTGFFGHDTSSGYFTYIPIVTSVSGEVVTGPAGIAEFSGVRAPNQTLTLTGVSAANATVTLNGAATAADTSIVNTSYETLFTSATGIGRLAVAGDLLDPSLKGTITTSAFTAARTFTLPDITGTFPVATTGGATSGWILQGAGASTVNTWINPAASGFTAFAATNSVLQLVQATKTGGTYGVLFSQGTGYKDIFLDSANDIVWNTTTNTLTLGNGTGKLEGVVDGGGF